MSDLTPKSSDILSDGFAKHILKPEDNEITCM